MQALGLLFPLVGRELMVTEAVKNLKHLWTVWKGRSNSQGIKKSQHPLGLGINRIPFCTVLISLSYHRFTGGSSGTGKTRFFSSYLDVVESKVEDDDLRQAVVQCRKNRLHFSVDAINLVNSIDTGDALLASYLASRPAPLGEKPPHVSIFEFFDIIEAVDGGSDTLVVIHIDETNALRVPASLEKLGQLVSSIWSAGNMSTSLCVVVLLSGTRRLALQEMPSSSTVEMLPIDVLKAADYTEILRGVFKLGDAWVPSKYLHMLLEDIEGPPRLLQLLLAVGARAEELSSDLISTEVSMEAAKSWLTASLTAEDAQIVSRRCRRSLRYAHMVTWELIYENQSLFESVFLHSLTSDTILLTDRVVHSKEMTFDVAVSLGYAMLHGSFDDLRLCMPHLYMLRFWDEFPHLLRSRITTSGTPGKARPKLY
eukprot:TRINITY_DN2937_c1_g1_i2.p1 TRINITY_DN2937_c1_g1~~TRINITY_DN2937_c1_g1_i2.p1  ORF type:complete len:426 (-),score=53.99 TRINITY_DN2937_c1_g1_i2:51-1328(-)